ncbi:CheR family methyltransferase [Engelhardtia mirabilis]|uniref:protein-glutamate O-methyltransferase n=1 Tax=Engelhardtia mirabilis TaxID=2528011 RepID=A0A518BSC0_9BACT|nr:Chemotaxis protein methyltransferase [Planctomycetes bacterium Pla133]QDV04195.1 Chemotaxis protein methyltransferase [Planctomycetes bacterium Pla86]
MKTEVFEALREIVYDNSGILLREGKESMVSSRIAQRLRALKLSDESAYLDYLRADLATELVQLLDVISTNVTNFFREPEHFDSVAQHLSETLAGGQSRLRLWSAASSTGEEPYSLSMTVLDVVEKHKKPVDVKILATDISTRVLETASNGFYEASKIDPIPDKYKQRYMEVEGEGYRATPKLREQLVFKRLNLSKPPFPMKGPMDVVMCRNVMIYFDEALRAAIVTDCHRLLRPGGLLVVGKSESIVNANEQYSRVAPSVYRKRE